MASLISASDSEATLPLNAVFQSAFLRQATPLAPYFAGTKPAVLDKQKGSNVAMWRQVSAITPSTTALSEQTGSVAFFGGRSTDVTASTNITATLAKYGQVVAITEEVDAFNPVQQGVEIMKSLAIAGGRSINMLQRNKAEDGLTKVYSGGAASTGAVTSKITRAAIDSVVNTLARQNAMPFVPMTTGDTSEGTAPILPAFWGLCHPDVAYDIMSLPGFQSVQTYAAQTKIVRGEFGIINGGGYAVRFIQSSDATIDADSGGSVTGTGLRSTSASVIDIYTTVIYGQECLGSVGLGRPHTDGIYVASQEEMPSSIEVIEKGFGSAGIGDPFDEIRTIAYKVWHAAAVLNANWGRAVMSGATSL